MCAFIFMKIYLLCFYQSDRFTMHKILLYAKITARRFSNPVFIGLLGLSLLLWYVTKLSYTYTTDLTVPVRIDSTQYTVRCNVEGVSCKFSSINGAPRKIRLSCRQIILQSTLRLWFRGHTTSPHLHCKISSQPKSPI